MTALSDRPDVLPEDRAVEDLASALDAATARLAETDRLGRQVANELKDATDAVHRAALVHIVRALRADPRGKELLFDLVDDPSVRMALLLHGIIRPDPMTQARAALDSVRPQLQSHGGDVELVRIEEGTVFVRLSGACNGCSMSAVTMRNGVEQALKDAVPGVTGVEVLPNEPGPAFIPLGAVTTKPAETGWVDSGALDGFALGAVTPVDGGAAVVVNVGGQLQAYVNACAHMGLPLDDAEVDDRDGSLTCQWHGFCFDALTGECRTLPNAQLDPLPLRVEDGHVWVRTGT